MVRKKKLDFFFTKKEVRLKNSELDSWARKRKEKKNCS